MFNFRFDFCVHKVNHLQCLNFFIDNLSNLIIQPSNYIIKFIDINDFLCIFVLDVECPSRINDFYRFNIKCFSDGSYYISELTCDDDIGYTI